MRALLIVLDGVGVGEAHDAETFGDQGADTLGHVLLRDPDLKLPTLVSLGLGEIHPAAAQAGASKKIESSHGRMCEHSAGKDTTTGHWEIAGVLLQEPFATFGKFPAPLVEAIQRDANIEFIGNYAQSGTVILNELGETHLQTGRPILYTSADSVMQIAAHESVIPVKRLHEICRIARNHCDAHRIARVIARPFTGKKGKFTRTYGRHDYSLVPPRTILNAIADAGLPVEGVGKISDIFARSGVTQSHPTKSNKEGMRAIEEIWHDLDDGLVFANLVDFDTLYGHRRDPDGFATALAAFDAWLAEFLPVVESEDLLIITADHGNDPTFHGSDHTREEVPLIAKYDGRSGSLGMRESFADVAATLAAFFQLKEKWPTGHSFFRFDRKHAPRLPVQR